MPQSSQTDRRRKSLRAAHSATLHLIMLAPVPPTSVRISCNQFAPDEPEMDVAFHRDPASVRSLAAKLEIEVSEGPHAEDDPSVFTVANGEISGIPVRIWSLIPASAEGGAA